MNPPYTFSTCSF